MAIWVVRAGAHGEYEAKFLRENRVYLTWETLNEDLSTITDRPRLLQLLESLYPEQKRKALLNWTSQIWPFVFEMKQGDLVVVPLKTQPAIQIGEISGGYHHEPAGPDPYFHWRPVRWVGEAVPRSHFGKDLLYSFGAFLTICRIQRNNAEARLAAMRAQGWKAETAAALSSHAPTPSTEGEASDASRDLGELAQDQIARLIEARFKGHGLTRLVEGILKAQGYTTYRAPEGADGGADILAGAGPLGFGAPRLCVEVKSESQPIDRPTVDKLLGAVTKFGAQEGLFVSWSGFKTNVPREFASSFFRVRLWSQKELFENLFAHYDQLDPELRAELPLKRIWTVAGQEE